MLGNMQWYQSDLEVTVCLETNGIDAKTISGKFETTKCIITASSKSTRGVIVGKPENNNYNN